MTERPILMSAPMVRAILEGRKTQTRRIVRGNPHGIHWCPVVVAGYGGWVDDHSRPCPCPYGQRGDRLYVKEHAWMWCEKIPNGTTKKGRAKFKYVPLRCARVFYCADHPEQPAVDVLCEYRGYPWGWRKKLGRFLPRWASRITLETTAVRVERLQDISEADAKAEGVTPFPADPEGDCWTDGKHATAYHHLWNEINGWDGASSWDANPWVWVIQFRRLQS
jgi:hypothetical protein